MTDITLGAVTLPGDMQWIDEFRWSAVSQQIEVTTGGSLLVEESAQLAGRPITLEGRMDGSIGFALPVRSVIAALQAMADAPLVAPMTLALADGRSFSVRFRYGDGVPVEAAPIKHIVPAEDTDLYTLTLRLMQV